MRQDVSAWRTRSAVATLALFTLLVLAAAGCSRNGGNPPSDFTPPGIGGANVLTVEMVRDTSDPLSQPSVRLRVYDRSQADGYGLYRKLPGQGFDRLMHDPLRFDGTYNQRVETYEAIDHDWQPNRQAEYLARGEFGGVETGVSPTTNDATLPSAANADSLLAQAINIVCPVSTSSFTAKVDSTPVLKWSPIPGAIRYLIRIVRLDQHIFFYGFTPPDGSTSYKLGSGLGDVMHENTLTLKSFFYWTVEGIDGNSRVVGRSPLQNFEVRTITKPDSLIFCTP
ncbi:MAG TPA: hypothetical protein VKF80_02660 [Candidatus Eisenbacteria bacterium]|nr:hypothetical protein [Candidatus Eisenbacteria bacterium]